MKNTKGKRKEVKLNRYEKALLVLARIVERCPYNDYRVERMVLEELGLEEFNPTIKK